KNADLAIAVEPLAKVVQKHPELTVEVVQALAYGSTMRGKAVPHLRTFCAHADPEVRAAAITGLCNAAPDDVEKELRATLQDRTAKVRQAAAQSYFQLLRNQRPPLGPNPTEEEVDQWVEKCRAGKDRAAWLSDLGELLPALLTAESPKERLHAALPLI